MILDSNWANSQYTIGGKFYEYLRLRKPILAIVPDEGEASIVIKNTDSGIIVSENKAPVIANALKQLLYSKMTFSWKGIERFDRLKQAKYLSNYLWERN